MTTYLRWDAPTTGPKPDGYEIYIDGVHYKDVAGTEIDLHYCDAEEKYEVRSYRDVLIEDPLGVGVMDRRVSQPVPHTRGHRITDIKIGQDGVVLTFATRIGSTYSVERAEHLSNDLYGPWVEIFRFVADSDPSQRGGDPVRERAYYRTWRLT